MVGSKGNDFSASTLDILAGRGQANQSVGSDAIYGSAGSNLPGLVAQSGDRYNALSSLASTALQNSAAAGDTSTWIDNENFQNSINNKYDWQAGQMDKGVAAAGIVGSAEVAKQVADRKMTSLADEKAAYDELAEAGNNLMKGYSLPPVISDIVGLFVPSYNIGRQTANMVGAISKINNIESQDALDDEMVLQKAFGQAGYNPLANEIIEPFNKWESQYVQEQVALQKNKIEANKNKNSALQTALGAYQAQNHMVDTLAGIHHDEVAERTNVLNKANEQEERNLDYQKDLSANQRTAVSARVKMLEDQTLNRSLGLEERKQDWAEYTYPDELAQQYADSDRKDLQLAKDIYSEQTERMKAKQELPIQVLKSQSSEYASDANRYVADQNLKAKIIDATGKVEAATIRAGSGGKSTNGKGSSGDIGKQSFESAANAVAAEPMTVATYNAETTTATALFNNGLSSEDQKQAEQLFANGQAMYSSEDPVTKVAGSKLMIEGAKKMSDANKKVLESLPKSQQQIIKAISNNPSKQLEPKDQPMVNSGIAKGELQGSNNPFFDSLSYDVNERVGSRLLDLAQAKPNGKDITRMTEMEIKGKTINGELGIGEKGDKLTADERKALASSQLNKVIDDVLNENIDGEGSYVQQNRRNLQREVERNLAKQLGSEVNAQAGRQVVDTENLPERQSLTDLAFKMADAGFTNNQIMETFGRLKQPAYSNRAVQQIAVKRATNTDPVATAFNFRLGTNNELVKIAQGYQGIGNEGKLLWQAFGSLPRELDQYRAAKAQSQLANQMLMKQIYESNDPLTNGILNEAGRPDYSSRPKTARNSRQSASSFGTGYGLRNRIMEETNGFGN